MNLFRANVFRVLTIAIVMLGVAACGDGGNPTFGGGGAPPVTGGDPPPVTGNPPPNNGGNPPPDDGGSPPPDDGSPPPDDGGSPPPDDGSPPPDDGDGGGVVKFTVGGSVTGLSGSAIRIQVNAMELSLTADGDFTLPAPLADGTAYNFSIIAQPSSTSRACTVDHGSGIVSGGNVTNVEITCGNAMRFLDSIPVEAADHLLRQPTSALRFSTPLDASTIDPTTVSLTGPTGPEPITVTTLGATVTVVPDNVLAVEAPYTVTVSTNARGSTGERLRAPATLSFTTGHWENPKEIETSQLNAGPPQIAFDAQGNALAVWKHFAGASEKVWANRYIVDQGWGEAVVIPNQANVGVEDPALAVDPNGNAFVVWVAGDPGQGSVLASRYDVVLNTWSDAELIETEASDASFTLPSIGVDASGNALAVWTQPNAGKLSVRFNRYDTIDHQWGNADVVEHDDTHAAFSPQIAMNSTGAAQVLWMQDDDGGVIRSLLSSRYLPDGTWGTADPVELEDGEARSPRIALDASGNALAVWTQSDGTHFIVRANRYLPGGWVGARSIEDDVSADAFGPEIGLDSQGNAIVVWRKESGSTLANRYDVAGGSWSAAQPIETREDVTVGPPHVAVDADGNAVAVWQADLNDGNQGIVANRYTAGADWEDPHLVDLIAVNSSAVRIAADFNGNALAVWITGSGPTNIAANRFEK